MKLRRASAALACGHTEATLADSPAQMYEKYQVPAIFGPWAQVLIEAALPKQGEYVLDAACGTGIVARTVAGRVGKVIGIDLDPAMIAAAKEADPKIEWQIADLQELPFENDAFDLVICQQGIQFAPDRLKAMRELHRVLKVGGRAVLGIWSELENSPGQAAVFGAMGAMLGKDMSKPPPFSFAMQQDVLKHVKEAGFSNVKDSVKSLNASYPSARRFTEIMLEGTSKATRQMLDQLPHDRRAALMEEVVERLTPYETGTALEIPNESRIIITIK